LTSKARRRGEPGWAVTEP